MPDPPRIVLEGRSIGAAPLLHSQLTAGGWRLVAGWTESGPGVVCVGTVDGPDAAAAAVLAAVAGAGLLIEAIAPRDVIDRLCDDLRRMGPVDHRVEQAPTAPALSDDERALLELLLGGSTLRDAAAALHLSRRTADRRMASACRALGVASTAEALVAARRMGMRASR